MSAKFGLGHKNINLLLTGILTKGKLWLIRLNPSLSNIYIFIAFALNESIILDVPQFSDEKHLPVM